MVDDIEMDSKTEQEPRKLTVLYGTKGGMGDVGKFAAAHAAKQPGVEVTVVAMSRAKSEGSETVRRADVRDQALNDALEKDLAALDIMHLDVDAPDVQQRLEEAVRGSDAVVACLSNRQPGMKHWNTPAAKAVCGAMAATGVTRLVQLSSFGIGDDYMPVSGIKIFWGCLLRTVIRGALADLRGMEKVVQGSALDYLLVRPMGIAPEEVPIGSWKVLTARGQGALKLTIAKPDVAAYMVQEALQPTQRRTAITIGQPTK